MSSLVIVFPKIEDGKRIRDILIRHGFEVNAVCSTAAAALGEMNNLSGGIVITGYKLPDMFFTDLKECMPSNFEMLLIASNRALSAVEGTGVVSVSMPLSTYELVNTLEMMQHNALRRKRREKAKPKVRSEEEQRIIDKAKNLLMDRNHMTEAEAHRYIQKCSMDSGTNLVETAQMVLTLMNC
ncbi:MAG: ANTAR domain-containing response regulator [Fusicatenibacter sp.]|nr:ANTAR domain-containing protein [Fusicatenibacter sp.]